MQQAAGWRARQEPVCFGLAAPASQAPTSGAVQAQGHSLGAGQCRPRPGLCVFKYHVSPKQQSVRICGECSEELWFERGASQGPSFRMAQAFLLYPEYRFNPRGK